jgi:hypothetical protein
MESDVAHKLALHLNLEHQVEHISVKSMNMSMQRRSLVYFDWGTNPRIFETVLLITAPTPVKNNNTKTSSLGSILILEPLTFIRIRVVLK